MDVYINMAYQANGQAALGLSHGGPNITDANLAGAVAAMSGFTNTGMNPATRTDMTILIISVIEATRLNVIEQGVTGVPGKTTSYTPD